MILIKMQTAEGKTADVHPDMVEDYKAGGYLVVEQAPEKKRAPTAHKK